MRVIMLQNSTVRIKENILMFKLIKKLRYKKQSELKKVYNNIYSLIYNKYGLKNILKMIFQGEVNDKRNNSRNALL